MERSIKDKKKICETRRNSWLCEVGLWVFPLMYHWRHRLFCCTMYLYKVSYLMFVVTRKLVSRHFREAYLVTAVISPKLKKTTFYARHLHNYINQLNVLSTTSTSLHFIVGKSEDLEM
jgi:hypothetical protein